MESTVDSDLRQYVVVLSGTHVTGKETLAVRLSESWGCRWTKAEQMHAAAGKAAETQLKRGLAYDAVFQRVLRLKLDQAGFMAQDFGGKSCVGLLTSFAMRPQPREAMRRTLLEYGVRPIFVLMQITETTLPGRTLGAEEPGLAESILKVKIADLQHPLDTETDVIEIDSTQSVDDLFIEISDAIAGMVREN